MLVGPYLGDLILGGATRTRGDFVLLFVTATAVLPLPALLLFFVRAPGKDRSAPTRLRDFVRTIREHWPGTILLVNLLFGVCPGRPWRLRRLPRSVASRSSRALFRWPR